MQVIVLLKKLALPIIVALSVLFYKVFPKIKQDNPVEEVAELAIEIVTGEDVDLSPETPEFMHTDKTQQATE